MSENETSVRYVYQDVPVPLAPLYAALAKAQGEFKPIERNRSVTVQPKKRDDGSWPKPYTFDYAPLEEVLSKCMPALNANGLSLFHRLDLKNNELVTVLAHESGATIEQSAPVRPGDWQQIGSAVTYARRYTVQCLLGVAAEYDDDGNAADGNEVQPQAKAAPRSQPTPPAPKPPQAKPAPRAEAPKAPPVDPQVQADIERRKQEALSRPLPLDVIAKETLVVEPMPPEAADMNEPNEPAAPPSWTTLADGHVPDEVDMRKGSATGALMKELFVMRGFSFEGTGEIARTLSFIAEHSGGGNPQVKDLRYGQARAVIRALEAL